MANFLFNIETVPRALGRYIVHRATCGIRLAPLRNIGGAVNEYEGYGAWGYEKVIPCAYCMPVASSLKAGGWPYGKPEEKPPRNTEPLVGELCFARLDNGRWYPALYLNGPHRVKANPTHKGAQYHPVPHVFLANQRYMKEAFLTGKNDVLDLLVGFHYLDTAALRGNKTEYEGCTYYGESPIDGYPVFQFRNHIYESVKLDDIMAMEE